MAERFYQQMHVARLAAEDEARRKEDARRQQRRDAQAMVRAVERRKVGRKPGAGNIHTPHMIHEDEAGI